MLSREGGGERVVLMEEGTTWERGERGDNGRASTPRSHWKAMEVVEGSEAEAGALASYWTHHLGHDAPFLPSSRLFRQTGRGNCSGDHIWLCWTIA